MLARSNYGPVKENGIIMNSHNHGDHVIKPYKGELLLVRELRG